MMSWAIFHASKESSPFAHVTVPILIAIIFIGTAAGGVINRLRGWSGGWGGSQNPKWLVWLQGHIFTRYFLSVLMGVVIAGFACVIGKDPRLCLLSLLLTPPLWYFGIVFGWGDYFLSGDLITPHEISWIDNFVLNHVRPSLRSFSKFTGIAAFAKWAESAEFIDCFSAGLRDSYYIPLFISLWPLAHWWVLLPIAFFWQDAVIYYWCRLAVKGDYVADAEPSTGDLRTLLMLIAIAVG